MLSHQYDLQHIIEVFCNLCIDVFQFLPLNEHYQVSKEDITLISEHSKNKGVSISMFLCSCHCSCHLSLVIERRYCFKFAGIFNTEPLNIRSRGRAVGEDLL